MINYRKDAKKAVKFTIMVSGELGTGKTTFINCLLDRNVVPRVYEGTAVSQKTLLFTLAATVALLNTSVLPQTQFDPSTANEEPGIALIETSVEVADEDDVRLHLNIIDTPGFGDNLNNELCFVEIENYLKQQLDLVLAEETRVRRNPRFVDTRVHVLLYFITPTGHGLREIDVSCMKRLSKYVNIIPVIGRADTFTESELKQFKNQIKIDIERFNVPVFQFDNFMDEYDADEDYDLIQECKYLTKLQPFAVVASEQNFEIKDINTGERKTIKARQYPWGLVDINNTKYSDFQILKSVILCSHLQDLKDLTHDFLYETYRTERLSKVTGKSDDNIDDSQCDDTIPQLILAAVPSLSNLALLTNNGDISLDTSMQDDTKADEGTSFVSKPAHMPKSMLLPEEDNAPKKSPRTNDSASMISSSSSVSGASARNALDSTNQSFKRMSIAPQRHQLRQISETVPYVIRHERILERQQKLEEIEMASARELANRAALLEQKAAELKAKEKILMQKLEAARKVESERTSIDTKRADEESVLQLENARDDESQNYTAVDDDTVENTKEDKKNNFHHAL